VNLIDAPIVAETASRHDASVGDATSTLDKLNRPLRDLRLSVIDQCNFRCTYCMPRDVFGADYPFLPSVQRLSFGQMVKLAKAFALLGVEKIRITGGEPLLRRGLESLIEQLAKLTTASGKPMELALTTNGSLLAAKARSLRDAGLGRVTVSLDAVDDAVFRRMSDVDMPVSQILDGIEAARAVGLAPIKVNAVVERGVNDSQILPLVRLFKGTGVAVRFIEYMDVGGATQWSVEKVFTRAEMLDRLGKRYGTITPLNENSSAPAERFRLPDGTVFGIIASTTTPFCRSCDRSRLTADGFWYLCLYAQAGIDLRQMLRAGAAPEEIAARISTVWHARTDRGAELRAATGQRGVLVGIEQLRLDPHLEMHTRGG